MAQNGISGVLCIIGIAIGVAIPNVVAQKYLNQQKELRIQQLMSTRHIMDGQ